MKGRAVIVVSREPEDSRDKKVSELYVAYRNGVRTYLINSVGCPEHEADDVLQDTILIVRDRWDQIRSLEKPAAYWYKIAGRSTLRTLETARICPALQREQALPVSFSFAVRAHTMPLLLALR